MMSSQTRPVLVQFPHELTIKWQWQRNGDYLAGFRTQVGAENYGKMKGWI